MLTNINGMSIFISGQTYFNEHGEYVRVLEVFEDGTHTTEIIETAHDYQHDLIVRNIVQEPVIVKAKAYGEYNYPHAEINNMSGY